MKLFSSKKSGPEPLLLKPKKVGFGGFSNLTQPFKKPEKKELAVKAIQQRLMAQAKFPIKVLEDATNIMSMFSRQVLKPERRLEITNTVLKVIYPIISGYYDKYQSQYNSLPESNERRHALVASIHAIAQVNVAFKQLFTEYYLPGTRQHRKNGKHAYEYAFRVLEFILVEQRLRALRYQKLLPDAWLDCNQVFFAMAKHEHIDDVLHLYGPTGIRARPANQSLSHPYDSSVRRLYQSIQLFGVLDVSTWPTHLFHVPDALQESMNTSLHFMADHGDDLPPATLLMAHRQACPPMFTRPENAIYFAILLDYSEFYAALVEEYEKIAGMQFINKYDEKKLIVPLQKIAEADRVPVLELMLNRLRVRERSSKRHSIFKNNTVRVYFGLTEVFRLLGELVGREFKHVLREKRLNDQLALKSSLLFTGEKKAISAQWQMVNFSAGGILISTMESDFSTPVQLGQLVAFLAAEDKDNISLGYVCRLNRPQDNLVEVGINRLSNYTEIVVIRGVGEDEEGIFMTAILVQNAEDNWQLVTVHHDQLIPGKPLTMTRNKQKIPARLGDVCLTKKEFKVFDLRSPGLVKERIS